MNPEVTKTEDEQNGETSSIISEENSSENEETSSTFNQQTQSLETETLPRVDTNLETGEKEIPTGDNVFIKTVPTYPEFRISFEVDKNDDNRAKCFLHITKNGKVDKLPVKVTTSDAVKKFHDYWKSLRLSHNQTLVIEVKENGDISRMYIENADRSKKILDISQNKIGKTHFDSIQEVIKEAVNLNKLHVNNTSEAVKKFSPFDSEAVKAANSAHAQQQPSISKNVPQSGM